MKKINNIDYLFLLGSRGEWGYIRPLLDYCEKKKKKLWNMFNKYGRYP